MRLALRYELVRMSTAPATRVLLAVGVVGALLVAVGLCFVVEQADTAATGAGATESLAVVLTRSPVTVFVAGLIGAMAIGHDYRFGTIDTTLLVTPRRVRAFTAKALTVAVCSAALALLSLLIGWAAAVTMLGPDVVSRASVGILLGAQAGYIVFVIGWGLLGLALTRIFANQTFAIVMLVIWPFVIEPALKGMASAVAWDPLRELASYMPYGAGQALSTVPRATVNSLYDGAQTASTALAALAFVAVVCAATWAAAALFRSRPVAA